MLVKRELLKDTDAVNIQSEACFQQEEERRAREDSGTVSSVCRSSEKKPR